MNKVNRAIIISEAGKDKVLDLMGSNKFEGADRELVAALYLLSLDGASEDRAGSVEEGLAMELIYPYILTEDSQGFCEAIGPYDRNKLDSIMQFGDVE